MSRIRQALAADEGPVDEKRRLAYDADHEFFKAELALSRAEAAHARNVRGFLRWDATLQEALAAASPGPGSQLRAVVLEAANHRESFANRARRSAAVLGKATVMARTAACAAGFLSDEPDPLPDGKHLEPKTGRRSA